MKYTFQFDMNHIIEFQIKNIDNVLQQQKETFIYESKKIKTHEKEEEKFYINQKSDKLAIVGHEQFKGIKYEQHKNDRFDDQLNTELKLNIMSTSGKSSDTNSDSEVP
eukprot:145698_1